MIFSLRKLIINYHLLIPSTGSGQAWGQRSAEKQGIISAHNLGSPCFYVKLF
jgi:hypothetical protein